MRLLGWLLIAVCLTSGSIAASTAYMPRVSLADERFEVGVVDDKPVHLELKSVAGAQFSGDNSKARLQRLGAIPPDPSFIPGTALDGYALDSLRGDGAAVTVGTSVRRSNRVAVSEFSLARWDTWWLFLLSAIGLTGGACCSARVPRPTLLAAQHRPTARPRRCLRSSCCNGPPKRPRR